MDWIVYGPCVDSGYTYSTDSNSIAFGIIIILVAVTAINRNYSHCAEAQEESRAYCRLLSTRFPSPVTNFTVYPSTNEIHSSTGASLVSH